MKVSEQWLREWVDPPVDTTVLAEKLTMLGLEVDRVHPAAGEFSGVVVGYIESAETHPNADRLRVCSVQIAPGEQAQIVCGGVNARAGIKVAVAVVGAELPDNFKIKACQLRGVESNGMICSEGELGLGEGAPHAIMELKSDAPVGEDIRTYLQCDDAIIDIELTPNRGDCASMQGVAREVAAAYSCDFKLPEVQLPVEATKDSLAVTLEAPSHCPRYLGRLIKGISVDAQTPLWMCERLRRAGLRPIHPVVDILNYVMLSLGQPMHAFDADVLQGDIHVRLAKQGERLKALDDTEITLTADDLVIADSEGPVALAGVMGGFNSAVAENTRDIFLESAYFTPSPIMLTAKAHKFQTDASYRYERGVDYDLCSRAMAYASSLILDLLGGAAGPITLAEDRNALPKDTQVILRYGRIEQLLGISITKADVEKNLLALGLALTETDTGFDCAVPSHRPDITEEADLIEEVARLYGYNNIPQQRGTYTFDMAAADAKKPQALMYPLVARGYHEAITYSFIDEETYRYFSSENPLITLQNPLASDISVMRDSLWPGLLKACQYNIARQQSRVRLFEIGLGFRGTSTEAIQTPVIAGLATGSSLPEQWSADATSVDFFDVKADITALFGDLSLTWEPVVRDGLHPSQTAAVCLEGKEIGVVGQLHPDVQSAFDLSQPTYVFYCETAPLLHRNPVVFKGFSKFPAVRRDVAVTLPANTPAGAISRAIKALAIPELANIYLFDVYEGEHVSDGLKSIAIACFLQNIERTLVDDEISIIIHRVVECLESNFNAELRA